MKTNIKHIIMKAMCGFMLILGAQRASKASTTTITTPMTSATGAINSITCVDFDSLARIIIIACIYSKAMEHFVSDKIFHRPNNQPLSGWMRALRFTTKLAIEWAPLPFMLYYSMTPIGQGIITLSSFLSWFGKGFVSAPSQGMALVASTSPTNP